MSANVPEFNIRSSCKKTMQASGYMSPYKADINSMIEGHSGKKLKSRDLIYSPIRMNRGVHIKHFQNTNFKKSSRRWDSTHGTDRLLYVPRSYIQLSWQVIECATQHNTTQRNGKSQNYVLNPLYEHIGQKANSWPLHVRTFANCSISVIPTAAFTGVEWN